MSISLGWDREQRVDRNRHISNAISSALKSRNQEVLIFAAASNLGGSKRELFPAKHSTIFAVRGASTKGKHKDWNPALPTRNEPVFGTLGVEVPIRNRGKLPPQYLSDSGTSFATAVMAGIAATIVGYMNVENRKELWDNVRTFDGFRHLLEELSTEPETRKLFVTLEHHLTQADQVGLETALSKAHIASQ